MNEKIVWNEVKTGEIFVFDDKNKFFEGIFSEKRLVAGTFGNQFAYDFEVGDGEFKTIFGTDILSSKLNKVKEGSLVKIEYLGLKKGKSGREYRDFNVFVGATL